MKRQDYYPVRIGDQIVWLRNLETKLPTHAQVLGLDSSELTDVLVDAATAIYALDNYRGALGTATDAAYQRIDDVLFNDTIGGTITWLGFTPPASVPAAVEYGVLKRVFAYIADKVKKSVAYDAAIGADLGVEGAVQGAPDPATTAPDFTLRPTGGGKLEVVWTKGVFDGVKLEFDLGPAGTKADIDLRPNYTLNWLPATGLAATVKVRLLYIYKGDDFGSWSPWQSWTLAGV
jgi:hypothetical protein